MDIPTDKEESNRNLPNLPNTYSLIQLHEDYKVIPQIEIKSSTSSDSCAHDLDEIVVSAQK